MFSLKNFVDGSARQQAHQLADANHGRFRVVLVQRMLEQVNQTQAVGRVQQSREGEIDSAPEASALHTNKTGSQSSLK